MLAVDTFIRRNDYLLMGSLPPSYVIDVLLRPSNRIKGTYDRRLAQAELRAELDRRHEVPRD